MDDPAQDLVRDRGHNACGWDRQDPRPDNPARYPPSHGRQAMRSTHPDDGARDRVRRADGDSEPRREENREGAARLGAEPCRRAADA